MFKEASWISINMYFLLGRATSSMIEPTGIYFSSATFMMMSFANQNVLWVLLYYLRTPI